MMDPQLLERIKNVVVREAERKGICLVELNNSFQGRTLLLRIIVDKCAGSVTVDECADLNRKVGMALEEEDIIQDSYILEVSSPGLDRPLKTKEDFSRCLGRKVKFFLIQPINGKIEMDGVIAEVSEDGVKAGTDAGDYKILFSQIQKAKQLI
jgi:ribosome maturation factor RimP